MEFTYHVDPNSNQNIFVYINNKLVAFYERCDVIYWLYLYPDLRLYFDCKSIFSNELHGFYNRTWDDITQQYPYLDGWAIENNTNIVDNTSLYRIGKRHLNWRIHQVQNWIYNMQREIDHIRLSIRHYWRYEI